MSILITGGGSGLGKSLARVYGNKGNSIILIGRNEEKLKRTSSELRRDNIIVEYLVHDISNPTSIDKLINEIKEKYGKIDYLINNAGVGVFGSIYELKLRDIEKMLDINIKGTILMTQSLLPLIRKRIINIISTAGLRGKINESVYVASKFAIRGFTESLQKELASSSIKLTSVYMGGMNTPFWDESDHIKDKERLMSPLEVAKEILKKDDGRAEIIIERDK